MFNKLKEVKDLRSQAKALQNSLAEETIEVVSKDCTMSMDGNQKIIKLDINEKYLNKGEKSKLEGIIIDLHDQVTKKVQKVMMKKMRDQGGFDNFPGMGS